MMPAMRPTGSKRTRFVRVVLAVGLALVLLLPDLSWGRAGGGQGFRSGGGGGGFRSGGGFRGGGRGFGGSGSGGVRYVPGPGATRADWVIWFVVVLVIILILAAKARNQLEQRHETTVIRRGRRLEELAADAHATEIVRGADPAFDRDAFLARVRNAFAKIQRAWSAQDLTTVRPFVSDGVHERFELQFDEQRALGHRNVVEDVRVHDASLAHAETDGPFDTLSVRVTAQARDYDARLADGRPIPGTENDEPFVEIWTFLRRRGAATRPGRPGLIEGNCPNCGGAIEINQSANCLYCKALLRSGEYDWVLSEITQEGVWRPTRPSTDLPGAAAVRRADPEFNVQELEDLASVAFWRKATADRLADPKPLAKVSSEHFRRHYATQLMPRPSGDGTHTYVGRCAVGSVRTLGLLHADGQHRALVEVRWSGTRFAARRSAMPEKVGPDVIAQTLFVFVRSDQARSAAGQALSSNHCPNCGAPASHSAADACEFCGKVLNDPRTGWVLDDVLSMVTPDAQHLVAALNRVTAAAPRPAATRRPPPLPSDGAPGEQSPADLLAWLVHMAVADGAVSDAEQSALSGVALKHRLPTGQVERMVSAARSGQLAITEPHDRETARRWIDTMAQLAVADGTVDPAEMRLLRVAGRRADLVDFDLTQMIHRHRRDHFVAARDRVRDNGNA